MIYPSIGGRSLLGAIALEWGLRILSGCEFCGKEARGESFLAAGHLFGGAGGEDISAAATALGSHVDDVIGEFDDVEIVLDDDDGVAAVYQSLQYVHQDTDVFEMQTGGRFVEDIERLASVALAEFGGEFYALALATGESGGGLTELDVTQSDILKGFDLLEDARHILEKLHSLIDGHVEHVGNTFPFIAHLERLAVVSFAVAHFAGHEYVGQNVHLDGSVAVARTFFASPTLNVERESAGFVAAYLSLGQVNEEVADVVEYAGVGGWIGARRAAQGRLIYVDHLVYVFNTLHRGVGHRSFE